MKVILISILVFLAFMPTFAQQTENTQLSQPSFSVTCQTLKDTIEFKNIDKSNVYFRNGVILRQADIEKIVSSNKAASIEFRQFRSLDNAAKVLFIGGGALAVTDLLIYSVNEDSKSNYSIAPVFVGLAAIGIAIPIEISAKIHYCKAIATYNQDIKSRVSRNVQMKLALTPSGMGMKMLF
ncbi:hypothetical protein [Parabacteroides sp. FAFU027]|uniref:hypothetical protein n=1 Tax=Parabacteroides sp. FAFU027 TaxID=2922715 RepID=UPI001FAF56C3|nr:hypothetical protein [Parabacteroides sp. FAFU027]